LAAAASNASTTTRSSAAPTCFTTRPWAPIRAPRGTLRLRARRDRRCARVAARRALPPGQHRGPNAGAGNDWAKAHFTKTGHEPG
jgi:hypothetical protein